MHMVRLLILVWTTKREDVSHCSTWFETLLILLWTKKTLSMSHCLTCFHTQLILTMCHIRCHSD